MEERYDEDDQFLAHYRVPRARKRFPIDFSWPAGFYDLWDVMQELQTTVGRPTALS